MLEYILHHASLLNVIVLFTVTLFTVHLAQRSNESRNIQKLGTRASGRRHYLPYGIEILFKFVKHVKNHTQYELWQHLFAHYGHHRNPWTIELYPGGGRVIFTADHENIKAVLASQFADYGKGLQLYHDWHDFLGDSIFTMDGEKWYQSRQLLRPQFIKTRVSDLAVFERNVSILLSKLGGRGQEVNVGDLFFRYALDASTEFLLGHSVDSMNNPQIRFAEAFKEVSEIQNLKGTLGPFSVFLSRSTWAKFHDGIKVIDDFVNPFVERVLRLSPEEIDTKSKLDEGYTFLHALAGYTKDRTVLRDQIVSVLIAGRDTTASTLSWIFYQLSIHPSIQWKLRREIFDTVGHDRIPTYENLKSMKYLQHVINETLRLYPILPFNVRVALNNTTLPTGGGPDGTEPIGVLKDTIIAFSPLVLQRREDLYPPVSPDFPPINEFAPDRWYHWTPKSWTYIPFNGGPRICIGQQFALTEMAYTITRVFQKYASVEFRNGEAPKMKSDIILQPLGGVKVAFWEDAQKSHGE
ncbi:cytochrome P450 [Patellaria atrata CBS 101060]|uniref:Cytochrome P450 n=1 Tax=Patellaria atrata CBS 101060 TaxID=1346257 RepID=A0A9P4S504_9PEZI|nr:cytochrome P450 [Patellaria atrata CBS 101060]